MLMSDQSVCDCLTPLKVMYKQLLRIFSDLSKVSTGGAQDGKAVRFQFSEERKRVTHFSDHPSVANFPLRARSGSGGGMKKV